MIRITRAAWLLSLLAQALLPGVAVVSSDPDNPDKDGNEKLSVRELQEYMDFSLKQARKAVEWFDDTGDGEIDGDEFGKLMEHIDQQREETQNQEEGEDGHAAGVGGGDPDDDPDTDDSGGLSPAELLEFWKKGKDWNERKAEYFTLDWFARKVQKFDKDGDKQLNGNEYQKFIDAKDQADDDEWGEHKWGKSTEGQQAERAAPSRAQLDADAEWVQRRYAVASAADDEGGGRQEPERVRGLTAEKAARYIRSGRPFIVSDMVQDWGMQHWDCESVRRDFPDEEMQLWNSYDGGQTEMPRDVRLAEPWQDWLYPQRRGPDGGGEAAAGRNGSCVDHGSPTALSFLWYPLQGGAGQHPDEPVRGASPAAIHKLQASYALPTFLDGSSTLNQHFCKNRMEVFLGMPGAGAKLHADAVCEPIFSVQLAGRKRWRLSPLPPYQDSMPLDSNVYIARRPEGGWGDCEATVCAQLPVALHCPHGHPPQRGAL
jgi:hypothetical protein